MSTIVTYSNVYFVEKEMFISAEIASAIIQLQLASPAIKHMAAAQPQPKRRFAYRDAGVGLQLRGHTCGPDNCSLGLKWALTLKWNVSPSKSNLAIAEKRTTQINILHDHGVRKCVTPVDPAGPHCYRDRTKTC